jgi:hypothetical protein
LARLDGIHRGQNVNSAVAMYIELNNIKTGKRELFNVYHIPHVKEIENGFVEINKSRYDVTYNQLKKLIEKHHAKNTLEKINES